MLKHNLTTAEKLRVLSISTIREIKLLTRFKVSFLFTLINILFTIAVFFFISKFMVVDQYFQMNNYFSYVLIGLAVNQYVSTSIHIYLGTTSEAYWSNRLELILSSPTRLKTFFLATLLWSFIFATINICLYFVVGIGVFGANIGLPSNWYLIIPILFLVVISLSGIGLLSASMFLLVNAKGGVEPIGWAIATLSGVFTGVYFPPSILPTYLQPISKILPQTYALEAIRSIFAGKGLGDVQVAILYLILFSCILFPLGLWVFKKGIQKAEREGTLARWA